MLFRSHTAVVEDKNLRIAEQIEQGIDYSVTLCQTQEFMLRRFSVLKRYESFRENI